MSDELRQMLHDASLPEDDPIARLHAVRRRSKRRHRRRLIMGASTFGVLAVIGGAAAGGVLTAPGDREPANIATPGLITCGSVPESDSSLGSRLSVTLEGPRRVSSGSEYKGSMRFTLTDGSHMAAGVSPPKLFILKDGSVVGTYTGGEADLLYTLDVSEGASKEVPVSEVMKGCSEGRVDPYHPNESRVDLPAGEYELVAATSVVHDDEVQALVTEPVELTIVGQS